MFSLPGYDAWKTTDPRESEERDVNDECSSCGEDRDGCHCTRCVECGVWGCGESCVSGPDPDDDRADDDWMERNEP